MESIFAQQMPLTHKAWKKTPEERGREKQKKAEEERLVSKSQVETLERMADGAHFREACVEVTR